MLQASGRQSCYEMFQGQVLEGTKFDARTRTDEKGLLATFQLYVSQSQESICCLISMADIYRLAFSFRIADLNIPSSKAIHFSDLSSRNKQWVIERKQIQMKRAERINKQKAKLAKTTSQLTHRLTWWKFASAGIDATNRQFSWYISCLRRYEDELPAVSDEPVALTYF